MELNDGDLLAMLDFDEVGRCFSHFIFVMLACEMKDESDLENEGLQESMSVVGQAFEKAFLPEKTGLVLKVDTAYISELFVRQEFERLGIELDPSTYNVRTVLEAGTDLERTTLSMVCRNVALSFGKDSRVSGDELRELVESLSAVRTVEGYNHAIRERLIENALRSLSRLRHLRESPLS